MSTRLNSLGAAISLVMLLPGCCTFMPCHSSTVIAGRVTDVSGEPVSGASVRINDRPNRITNEKGCFLLDVYHHVYAQLEIRVDANGFKSLQQRIELNGYHAIVVLSPSEATRPSEIRLSQVREPKAVPVPECA
jgi:hypothetical protein